MAWADHRRGNYGLFLTDGYITELPPSGSSPTDDSTSFEHAMAERLYRLGKRARAPPSVYHPDTVHVWVIGRDGWQQDVPDYARTISENDGDPKYRMIIVGVALPSDGSRYLHRWHPHVRAAGMHRKKKHDDLVNFRTTALGILEPMADEYGRLDEPPSRVLVDYGLPFAFAGDSRNRLD